MRSGSISPTAKSRFWSRVNKTESCWEWTGAKDKGYGQITMYLGQQGGRAREKAHRAVFILEGVEIPEGKVVDHICRNRACVRPDHLRFASMRENVLENSESFPALNKQKTHCKRGHELSKDNVWRSTYETRGSRICRRCSLIRSAEQKTRMKSGKGGFK